MGMTKLPLFSVIVPTYHRNDLLSKCLDCLAPGVQKLPAEQYEVIVTDDGDQTTAQEMICDRYPWVKWVAGSGKGPAANRNHGSKYAQGDWLVFTDDDCLPTSSWLSAFALAIAPDISVYEGKTTCEAGIRSPLEHAPINLTGGYLWSCNMMLKRKTFYELGGFDQNFPYPHMEDAELRERIKNSGHLSIFVSEAVVDHPPRILPWGSKLGASQESLVMYWRKVENRHDFKANLFIQIIKFRLNSIRKYRISLDSVKAIVSLVIEILYVVGKIEEWDRKYPVVK